MPKFERWVRGKEDFASFPLLAALAQRPLTTLELAHILLSTSSRIRDRLVALEDKGWVVQRAKDKRWVMIVRLVATGIPEPRGVDGVTPGADIPVTVGPPTDRVVLEPVGEARQGADEVLVGKAAAEAPQRQLEPRKTDPERVAAHFGVPVRQRGADATIGSAAPCQWCGGRTVLRYGDRPTCPACAKLAPKEEEEEEA